MPTDTKLADTRPGRADQPRANAIQVKGTPSWKRWVNSFAKHKETTVPNLVEWALTQAAEREGFREPPRR